MANTPKPNKKRIVKNPETFRERAIKAADEEYKPSKKSRVGSFFRILIKPFSIIFSKLSKILGKFKIFRLIGRILYPKYIRNSWKELKLVEWPNWKQSRQLTFAVLVFAVIFGVLIAILDYGLDKLFRNILLK